MRDRFLVTIERAEKEANDLLDGILSEGNQLVERTELDLHNREVEPVEDVHGLLAEIQGRLMPRVKNGIRARLT